MGKGKRLKAERAAGSGSRVSSVLNDQLGLLQEAVIAVGDAFGDDPNCADAAALLSAAATELGFELAPRPVALIAQKPSTGDMAMMGPKATALVPTEQRYRIEDLRPDGMDNGHLVLTLEHPQLLIDANLRQLSRYGIDAPSLVLRIRSTHPEDGQWTAELEDLNLLYMLDDDNRVLIERFDEVVGAAKEQGRYLVEMLRAGLDADDIRALLTREPRP